MNKLKIHITNNKPKKIELKTENDVRKVIIKDNKESITVVRVG